MAVNTISFEAMGIQNKYSHQRQMEFWIAMHLKIPDLKCSMCCPLFHVKGHIYAFLRGLRQ